MTMRHRSGCDEVDGRVPVYILAGGSSRRFGSDKARATLDGVPLIARIADALRPIARSITVVAAEDGKYADLGLPTIGDIVEASGPIGGVLTAIDDHGEVGWIFVTACDWVGIRAEWVGALIDALQDCAARRASPHAMVFRSARREPLFGLYHSSIEDKVRDQINKGNLKMQDLLDRMTTVTVAAPDGWDDVRNINYYRELK